MDTKVKSTPKTKEIIRQMQAELRELQEAVHGARAQPETGPRALESPSKGKSGVQLVVHAGEAHGHDVRKAFTESRLHAVTNESAAAIGSAISSAQRVALMRALLGVPDGVSAASLSDSAGLTTGSLYHHLHDLAHAGLVSQSARSKYLLTEKGRLVLMTVLALAA